MSYQLGIDFGTTFTAAVVRRAEGTGDTEVVPLGGRGGAVSSVLHLARDGRVTVGEAGREPRRINPTRVIRGLKRRVGDAAPVLLGGQPWAAEELSARLVRWVVDRVVEKEGEPPATIALAHPVSWAPHTLERLAAALAGQDLGVTFVAEPRAVAHAAVGAAEAGATVAVHDFGGGRFDAAVLRRAGMPGGGFAVLGVPEAIDDLGGLDLDELVWQHVRRSLPDDVTPVARVRRACTLAEETLSSQNEVMVRIRCGDFRGAVRLDRPTFERLIAPHVDRTVDALRRTIAAAGVEPGQLTALLLIGGSARIPLLARSVAEQLGCVPTVRGDEDLVARGVVFALSHRPPPPTVRRRRRSALRSSRRREPTPRPSRPRTTPRHPRWCSPSRPWWTVPRLRCSSPPPSSPPPRRPRYRRPLVARGPVDGPLPSSIPAAAAPEAAAFRGRSSAWARCSSPPSSSSPCSAPTALSTHRSIPRPGTRRTSSAPPRWPPRRRPGCRPRTQPTSVLRSTPMRHPQSVPQRSTPASR